MTTQINTERRLQCPSCGKKAKQVSPATLRALLTEEHAGQIEGEGHACCASNDGDETGCQPISGDTGWRFCDSQNCDVAYFSEEGDTTFTKPQLRVAVGVKEMAGERPLCYCFGHSIASMKDELRTKGRSDALEDIRAKMKDPGCRCETENPSGACCLGSVAKGIKIAQEELGMSATDIPDPPAPAKSSANKGEKIAKVGTIVSAIMASSCCWLPLVLLAVGVSGAGIASTLEAYRPLFMVVTFGFLGAAFDFTYRPRKVAAGAGHGCCSTEAAGVDDCCAPATKGRFNMVALNKAMLWGVTVMAVAFLFFPSYVGTLIGGDGKTVTENMNRAAITVEGMTCEGCAALVAKAIRTAPGVLAVEVDYGKGEAVVGTEICCPVPEKEILTALEAAGYHGTFTETTKGTPVDAGRPSSDSDNRVPEEGGTALLPTGNESLFPAVFQINGMTCEGCAAGLSDSISNVPGVLGVQVDYQSGKAVVQSKDCCSVPNEKVLSAIETAGFDGHAVGEPEGNPAPDNTARETRNPTDKKGGTLILTD